MNETELCTPLGYYNGKVAKYGIAAKDMRSGQQIGPGDLLFVDLEEYQKGLNELSQAKFDLDLSIKKLTDLLESSINEESKYQNYFVEFPWVLGLQYNVVQSHRKLDDENIPDFTGVRVHDGYRDILEIKPPFEPLFTEEGELNAYFNKSWNQAERYLSFTRQYRDYLSHAKGLNFENPKCYLLCGYNLSESQLNKIRIKASMNPAIQFLTYDQLLTIIQNIIAKVKSIQSDKSEKK